MKRKKPTIADWDAHLPEWEAACKKSNEACKDRSMTIKELKEFIEKRNTMLDTAMSISQLDELVALERNIDAHAKKLVACAERLKLARKHEEELSVKYSYWR